MSEFDVTQYTRSITEGVAQAIRLSTIRERLGSGELVPALLASQASGQSWDDIPATAKEMWLHDAEWALEASGTIELQVAYQESERRRHEQAADLAAVHSVVEDLEGALRIARDGLGHTLAGSSTAELNQAGHSIHCRRCIVDDLLASLPTEERA